MKTAAVLILAIFAQATGNIFLSKGMRYVASAGQMGDSTSFLIFARAVESPAIGVGTALLVLFLLLFAATLSWADLSFVLPASSFGYVVNVAFAHYFLNEPVSPARWVGTGLISIGVILISRSGTRTVEAGSEKEGILVGAGQ